MQTEGYDSYRQREGEKMGSWIKEKKGKRRAMQLAMILGSLGVGAVVQYQEGQEEGRPVLIRGEPGEGESAQEWNLTVPGEVEDYPMEFEVEERTLTGDEEEALLEAALQEAQEKFLPEGEELTHITGMVCMQDNYQQEQVTADWEVLPVEEEMDRAEEEAETAAEIAAEEWIDEEGAIQERNLTEAGQTLKFSLELGCGERQLEHIFYGTIYPRKRTGAEAVIWNIQKEILQKMEQDPQAAEIALPDQYEGNKVKWNRKKTHTLVGFLVLGTAVAVGLELREKEAEQKKKSRRREQLERDYPDFVSKIALLTGTGMTMDLVWKKIGENYQMQRRQKLIGRHEVYEEVEAAIHQLKEGVGEVRVYEEFGERCELPEYRRLSSYISQNLRKGTRELESMLERESETALEKRRSMARKYGEEAGTKMLFPMLLMLGIVIGILMVPAFLEF